VVKKLIRIEIPVKNPEDPAFVFCQRIAKEDEGCVPVTVPASLSGRGHELINFFVRQVGRVVFRNKTVSVINFR
jgi:hypothetical protein